MEIPKDFVQQQLKQTKDNLAIGGLLLNENTLGRAAVDLLQKGKEPTVHNLREYLLNQRATDPKRDHFWVPALELLEELASQIQ
jgi:hypothetical protein